MIITQLGQALSGLLALVIPIVAIIGGISYAAYLMYLRHGRQREMLQMHHLERMAAIEKGLELPPQSPFLAHERDCCEGYSGRSRHSRLSSGLTLLLVGAAITVAMWQTNGDDSYWWGLVIVAWGLGRVASAYFDRGEGRGGHPGQPSARAGGSGGPAGDPG